MVYREESVEAFKTPTIPNVAALVKILLPQSIELDPFLVTGIITFLLIRHFLGLIL